MNRELNMENEIEVDDKSDNIISVIIGLVLISIFFIFYYLDEKRKDEKLDSCSIITIAYSTRFVPQSTLYYYFYLNNSKIEYSYTIPFSTMGKFSRNSTLLNERFWIRVYCKDYQLNSICWEVKVPDTLQYIPNNGWAKIPYGLVSK
jgi:hypothetical protein